MSLRSPSVFNWFAPGYVPSTEIALAATPDQLLDRVNLLLMAGEMDATLRGQILAALNSIAIPSGDQNAWLSESVWRRCAPRQAIQTRPALEACRMRRLVSLPHDRLAD